MKFINEFRDPKVAKSFFDQIKQEVTPNTSYRLMEFCGGHTHALHRYGILSLLPDNVEMIHGPGCPVCVLPIPRIDQAIKLAQQPDVIFTSYADMLRVPGSKQDSLLKVKARGADVRMIYSIEDAIRLAQNNPNKKVIFFAIGFETTTPPTAFAILKAKELNLKNFFVFCNHVLTPIAMDAILAGGQTKIDGFIGPSNVSIVIGSNKYHQVAEKYNQPVVIAGFEPLDMLQSILMLMKMINQKRIGVENQYTRAVSPEGNKIAQTMIKKVLGIRNSFEWRGLGEISSSALCIHSDYAKFDAEIEFDVPLLTGDDHKECACPEILRGIKKPKDCKLFGLVCTPEQPMGACMVSSEGSCAAEYQYGTE